ncbi:MAG: biopolymer transporter ExbD [Phycisphaerales bacterium]
MRRRRPATGTSHPNLTPMIDVVMVLIVFYLLVGQLASDQRSDLALPKSSTGDDTKEASATFVNVRFENEQVLVDIDGSPVEIARLGQAVRAAPAVHLRADASIPYARLTPVLRELRGSGVRAVRVAAEQTAAPMGGP